MLSSTKILRIVLLAVAMVGCATTKKRAASEVEPAVAAGARYLDWQLVEARLADLSKPLDPVTRDQVLALKIGIEDRQHELPEWVVPLLNSYLPRGDKVDGHVVFDVGRSMPTEITSDGIAYIDLTAPEWKTDKERLWAEVTSALYRCALTQALPIDLDEPTDTEAFTDHVLRRLMVSGLATYVTVQGAPIAKASTAAAALMLRDQRAERFQKLEVIMATARTASPQKLREMWDKIVTDEPQDRLLGITGAAMAEAIEARESRVTLMETVVLGQRAFYNSYNEGRPGALVRFDLPANAVAPLDELPLLDALDKSAH